MNTASPSLLSYIAGINMGIAKNIVAQREEEGIFKNRKQLLKVKKLGAKTFEQCAGFMRISGGDEPLDSTSVHPESYKACDKLLGILGIDKTSLTAGGVQGIDSMILSLTGAKTMEKAVEKLSPELGVGEMTLTDIISELKKPARDPRDSAPPVIFRKDVTAFEDLKPGMILDGTIRNVVDFGAFVDIGVKQDGLVHVSQLSDQFVKDPLEVVSVGDNVKVKIIEVDREKNNIALSMKGLNKLAISTNERTRGSKNKRGEIRANRSGKQGSLKQEVPQDGKRLKSLKDLKNAMRRG